jgi:hypothetical protein
MNCSQVVIRVMGMAGLVIAACASSAGAATVSGDPSTDTGWVSMGQALSNGVYVKGSANYGYDTYTAGFTVQTGSNLDISDGSLSWLAGDTVIGVGGVFDSVTASQAGWAAFSGTTVNSLLSAPQGPKLQVKFGTSAATWFTSSTAPGAGNGDSSSSDGGGRVQVRTSGYFQTGTPTPGQTEPWTWDGNSGQVLVLDKDDHIDWDGASTQPAKQTARMIWNYNPSLGYVESWELLLNVSLLQRQTPVDFTGIYPSIGDPAIMTVQDRDGAYTDALVHIVPEPASLALLSVGGLMAFRRSTRRKAGRV